MVHGHHAHQGHSAGFLDSDPFTRRYDLLLLGVGLLAMSLYVGVGHAF